MAETEFGSVDEYIGSQPEAVRGILERVRSTIRKAVPGAQEVISYKMPTYTLNGERLLYFAVWKQHYSIYAATQQLFRAARLNRRSPPLGGRGRVAETIARGDVRLYRFARPDKKRPVVVRRVARLTSSRMSEIWAALAYSVGCDELGI